MFQAEVNGITIPYQRLGHGDPLLLIHGLGEIKEGWIEQYELANDYDLIIPDLRGHGESKITEGISIENFAKDIIGLLDHLEIENAHICGLSMGGAVTQEIYRQAPHRCRSLILVSTFHFIPKSLGKWFYQYRKLRSKTLSPEQQKEMAARTCLYSWKKENKEKFLKFYKPNKEGYVKSMKACLEVDNRDLLQSISIPTLVIGCQYDSIIPVWVQIDMHKRIPNSDLVVFKKSGHIAKLEMTEPFNETLRTFLKRQQQAV